MVFGKRSRSQSRERDDLISVVSEIEADNASVHEPANNESNGGLASPSRDRWDYSDTDHILDPSYTFTRGHPMGSILLGFQTDLTKLAEHVKMRDMTLNVPNLCDLFVNGTRLERAKLKTSIAINNSELEEKLIAKELQAHRLEKDVDPPPYFSPEATLTNNPNKLNECLKVFPRMQKFSGTNKDGQMTVVEYLTNLTLAQEQCRLSESEFLARMLASSTGQAHELINMWIQNNCTADQIYASLLIHFDKRPSPEESKTKLYAYRVARNESLAKAEGNIMILVGTAAKAVPAGPSRVTFINLESCHALMRALPEWSRVQVSNLYHSLSAKLGRTLTFTELDSALHALRANIDLDISQNGHDNSKPQRFHMNKYIPQNKYSTFSVNMGNNVDTIANKTFPVSKARTETSYTPRPVSRPFTRSRAPQRDSKPSYNGNNANRTALKPTNNGGGAFRKFNTRPSGNRARSNSRPRAKSNDRRPFNKGNGSPNKGCILCGMNNHKAETCRMMRDDQGVIKSIIPGYGKCTKCPARIQPRLNHPESLCPFRPNGPLFKKNN